MTLSRGKMIVHEDGSDRYKVCECGARFSVEFNTRGQMTSRKLCTPCRETHARHIAGVLPGIPAGVPRCADCSGICGLQYGSSITHLDHNGRCSSCAAWEVKRVNHQQRKQTLNLVARLKAQVALLEAKLATEPAPSYPPVPVADAPTDPLEVAAAYLAADQLARDHGLGGIATLEGGLRDKETAAMRQGVMQALRARGWPVTLIAALLNRHHTTVMHGLQRVSGDIAMWRQVFEVTLAGVVPDPVEAPALAQQIHQRHRALNAEAAARGMVARSHQSAHVAVPGPEGYVSPSILARRWQLPSGTVRYWIATGRLQAFKGPDKRLWLPDATPRPDRPVAQP